jgi:hypothetical protein
MEMGLYFVGNGAGGGCVCGGANGNEFGLREGVRRLMLAMMN